MTKRAYGRTGCLVQGCDRPHLARGYCELHYWRNHRHGSPYANPDDDGAGLEWLLFHRGYPGEDCIVWPLARNRQGYGTQAFNGRTQGAHRAMCILAHGEPPSSEHEAAHSCGRGHEGCVNPNHLSWKTPKENGADKVLHAELTGRTGHMKLTHAQCLEIIALRGTSPQSHVARRYGVSEATISRLLSGKRRGLAKSAA